MEPSSGIDLAEAEANENEASEGELGIEGVGEGAGKSISGRKTKRSGKETEVAVDSGADSSEAPRSTEMTEAEVPEEAAA